MVRPAAAAVARALTRKAPAESEEGVAPLCASRARSNSTVSEASTAASDVQHEQSTLPPSDWHMLIGRVWQLSRDRQGCRDVQQALDGATSDGARVALAHELHGHVVEAAQHPHANHVLQKCITMLPPEALQFMLDELLAREGLVYQAARHRFACRIVQHLLRKCNSAQVEGLAEAVLQDALRLSCRTFGSYAVEHVLQFGTEEQKYKIVRMVERNAGTICRSSAGSGVVAAAMEHAAFVDKVWIARAVLQEPDLLVCLAQTQQGSDAVVRVMEALTKRRERTSACASLIRDIVHIRASQFGRVVVEYLESQQLGQLA